MPRSPLPRICVALLAIVGLAADPAARAQGAGDREIEASRRLVKEVEQRLRELPIRDEQLIPIRALPQPGPPLRVMDVNVRPRGLEIRFENEPPDDEGEAEGVAPTRPRRILAAENFDRFIFGDGAGVEAKHAWLESALKTRIEAMARAFRLTDAQQTKLRVAGHGDMKRFFDRVEDKRREFELVRKNPREGQRFLIRLRTERADFDQSLFDGDSIFTKTLTKICNDRRAPPRP